MRGIHVQIDARPALFRLANGARGRREGGVLDAGAGAPRAADDPAGDVVPATDRFLRVREDRRQK